jgi:hypothetical protein
MIGTGGPQLELINAALGILPFGDEKINVNRLEATTPLTKLKLPCARFGGQRFGLVLR